MENVEVIDGKVYVKINDDDFDKEIARREDEIVRITNLLSGLTAELNTLKGKRSDRDAARVKPVDISPIIEEL